MLQIMIIIKLENLFGINYFYILTLILYKANEFKLN